MGQQLCTDPRHRPRVWRPPGGMLRLCPITSNNKALALEPSGPLTSTRKLPLPAPSFHIFRYFFLSSLPSTSRLCVFCTNVFGVYFIQKYLFDFFPFAMFSFFFFSTSLLFPAYVSTSPILTLLLTTPPKLAPSVNTGVYVLFTSLMKVLNKTRLNMQQEPRLPLNRWFLVVCQKHPSIPASYSSPHHQEACELILCVAMGHSTEELSGSQASLSENWTFKLADSCTGDIHSKKRVIQTMHKISIGFGVLGWHFWTGLGTKKKKLCREHRCSSRCPETCSISNIWVYGSGLQDK